VGRARQRRPALFVVPERDLVIAITAGNYDTAEQYALPATIMDEVIFAGGTAAPMG
jgi:hypothetical protein